VGAVFRGLRLRWPAAINRGTAPRGARKEPADRYAALPQGHPPSKFGTDEKRTGVAQNGCTPLWRGGAGEATLQQGTLALAQQNCRDRFPSTAHRHAGPAQAYVEATCRYQREPSSERRAVPVLCSPRRNEPGGQDKDESALRNRSFHIHARLCTDLVKVLARRLLGQCT